MRPLHDEHHGTTACHDIDSCPVSEPEFTASLLLDSGCLSKIKVIKTRDKPPVIGTRCERGHTAATTCTETKPCQRILCVSVNVCRPYVLCSTSRSNHAGKGQNDASRHDRPCIGIEG